MEYNESTQKGIKELCFALAETKDPQLMEDFLQCLLTKTEVADIANRWLLVREIDKGTTQREIARIFGMSLCKITRGSRELKKENSAFRQVIELFKNSQST